MDYITEQLAALRHRKELAQQFQAQWQVDRTQAQTLPMPAVTRPATQVTRVSYAVNLNRLPRRVWDSTFRLGHNIKGDDTRPYYQYLAKEYRILHPLTPIEHRLYSPVRHHNRVRQRANRRFKRILAHI